MRKEKKVDSVCVSENNNDCEKQIIGRVNCIYRRIIYGNKDNSGDLIDGFQ